MGKNLQREVSSKKMQAEILAEVKKHVKFSRKKSFYFSEEAGLEVSEVLSALSC